MDAQSGWTDRVRAAAHDSLLKLYQSMRADGEATGPESFFPVRLERVVQLMGWELEVVSGLGTVGAQRFEQLGRCVPGEKRIYLATDVASGSNELRFTLAHEIGHAALGHAALPCSSGGPQQAFRVKPARRAEAFGDEGWRTEAQANRFAAELLMPEKAVRKQFATVFERPTVWVGSAAAARILPSSFAQRQDLKLDEMAGFFAKFRRAEADCSLAGFFGVSLSAMGRRLIELRLIYG